MLEQAGIRKAELNSKLLRARSDEAEQEDVIGTLEAELESIHAQIRKKEEEIVSMEESLSLMGEELSAKDRLLRDCQVKYHEKKSKLESLKNLTERYEGYGNSIRRVMERREENEGICGVVADLIQVDARYETAIETALGGSIQNIVTSDEDTAKKMIRFLKENKLGRATFLPLTSVRSREFYMPEALKEEGVLGMADTLVKIDDKYRNIASHLLGSYIVMDTIDHALACAKKFNHKLRIVTVNGEALNPGGSISGGAFRNSSNLLGRKREIDELERQVKECLKEIDSVLNDMEEIKNTRTTARRSIEKAKEDQQDMFIRQNTARMSVNQAKERKEETAKGYSDLKAEGAEVEAQIKEILRSKEDAAEELSVSENLEQTTEAQIHSLTGELEEKRALETEGLAKVNELELSGASLAQKQEYEQSNLDRVSGEIERLREEEEFIAKSLLSTAEDVEQKRKDIEEIEKTIASSENTRDSSREILEQKLKEKEQTSEKQKNFFETREELSERMSALDKEIFRLSSQREKLSESSESQMNYMWNEYEITYNQALSMKNDAYSDLPAMKKNIVALKASIRELGDVNVNAIEDYRNISERYEFLRVQRDDILSAEEDLQTIIDELDEAMRRQFTEQFAEIGRQFDKVFKELFGGGKGSLELLAGEDVLEAGIKIHAQPPGKKLVNMMQMSGGEKALTAIALLFAIQNMKPSPFCLLDEIEAALDESNVVRFASYLKKLTKNTQFIVITHRRGTMEKSDRLYGITMQEKGVSALVSVNLINDEDLD